MEKIQMKKITSVLAGMLAAILLLGCTGINMASAAAITVDGEIIGNDVKPYHVPEEVVMEEELTYVEKVREPGVAMCEDGTIMGKVAVIEDEPTKYPEPIPDHPPTGKKPLIDLNKLPLPDALQDFYWMVHITEHAFRIPLNR